MLKKYQSLVLVCLPAFVLLVAVLYFSFQIRNGQEVVVRIKGYDPVSLLSGHYISYQLDLENTDCTQFENDVCPEADFNKVYVGSQWMKSGRFYVSENDAGALDGALRSSVNKAEIVYSYQKGKRPYALRLLINGKSFVSDK